MRQQKTNGMLVISAGPKPIITDPVEARRLINQDILKRAKQSRSHFKVADKDKRTWNGITFDSALEMRNHIALVEQERLGLIANLRRQVWYDLKIGDFLITRYRADHVYYDNTLKREVVADSKGKRTESFRIKKRLMLILKNIEIVEMS